MHSALYSGWVRHRRFAPSAHSFDYRVAMLYLDLSELDQVFASRWFWSASRPAVVRFRREQHFGDIALSLEETVRRLVSSELGRRPEGPIRLLCNPAYFGFCFNPISVFYCFDSQGDQLDALVVEVSNTPWKERHCYVLDVAGSGRRARSQRQQFTKKMHVSPFLGMDQSYEWRGTTPDKNLMVHIDARQGRNRSVDATLLLHREEICGLSLARALAGHPLMTWKVVAAIHWQALRLWLKRVPVHDHPQTISKREERA